MCLLLRWRDIVKLEPQVIVTSHQKPLVWGLQNRTVVEGEAVRFQCNVLSDLHPHISWVKHDQINGSYVNDKGEPYVQEIQVRIYSTTSLSASNARASAHKTIVQHLQINLNKLNNHANNYSKT